MRCSKLQYYNDLELASTSKKIDKDEFFQGALNCRFTVNETVVPQTPELPFHRHKNCRSTDTRTAVLQSMELS